jgi:hypothetical protein
MGCTMNSDQDTAKWLSAISDALFSIPQRGAGQVSFRKLMDILNGLNTPEYNRGYLSALLDLFRTYGAVESIRNREHEFIAATSEIAQCFIRSIGLSYKHGIKIIDTWHQKREEFDIYWSGAILKDLEEQRIRECKKIGIEPEVIRSLKFAQIIVIAENLELGKPAILFKFSRAWKEYNLIGGRLLEIDEGDLDKTASREIRDDLGIKNFKVQPIPDIKPTETIQTSKRIGALTEYVFHLYTMRTDEKLKLNPEGEYFWCTKEEIRKGVARDGKRITLDSKMKEILIDSLGTLPKSVTNPVSMKPGLIRRIRNHLNLALILTMISILVGIIGIIVRLLR